MQTQGIAAPSAGTHTGLVLRPTPVLPRAHNGQPRAAGRSARVAAADPRTEGAMPHPSDAAASPADKPFVHPELLEGPLEHLPLDRWSNRAASPSSRPTTSQAVAAQAQGYPSGTSVRQSNGTLWTNTQPTPVVEGSLNPDEQRKLHDSLQSSRFHVKASGKSADVSGSAPGSLPAEIYIIMYGKREGMYTLKQGNPGSDGVVRDAVVCFERQEDAERYACQLEAIMDKSLSAAKFASPDILEFCRDNNYACCMNPAGSLCMPPQQNTPVTDLDRVRNLQQGRFQVLESEPQTGARGRGAADQGGSRRP